MRINLRKTKPMKRDLVYTTGDLPMSPFDTTHFLTPSPHQNRRRRARVEKVGLSLPALSLREVALIAWVRDGGGGADRQRALKLGDILAESTVAHASAHAGVAGANNE
jgi:hypothetical protein